MTHTEKIDRLKSLAADTGSEIFENEPLSRHTTVKTGGNADVFIRAASSEVAAKLLIECRKIGLYAMMLGNGSNVLFSDEGFHGAVITTSSDASDIEVSDDVITAPAGAQLSAVCRSALDAGLTGLEFAYGIPGTVGGAVYMNAGAYGGEIKNVVMSVTAVNASGETVVFTPDELALGYRTSRFEHSDEIIVSAAFKLEKGDKDAIKAQMDELMSRRKSRQPLEYPSFGSAFKRPEGTFAGLVIEESGLKGAKVGGAQISPKHANFIVNLGDATSKDIIDLITATQKTVLEKTGYSLEPEVRLIPAEPLEQDI